MAGFSENAGWRPAPDDLLWVVAQLRPNGLERARQHLAQQGFVPFAPWKPETRRRRGRLVPVPRPLFPGYPFVGLEDPESCWRPIANTRGVSRLVRIDTRGPAQVPRDFIAGLLACCAQTGEFTALPDLAPGDPVRIRMGPFADLVGRIDDLELQERVRVLVDLMGRTVPVSLSARALERDRGTRDAGACAQRGGSRTSSGPECGRDGS